MLEAVAPDEVGGEPEVRVLQGVCAPQRRGVEEAGRVGADLLQDVLFVLRREAGGLYWDQALASECVSGVAVLRDVRDELGVDCVHVELCGVQLEDEV